MSGPQSVIVVGSVNMDLALSTERFPAPGETVSGREFGMFPGGKGANQAAASAKLGIATQLVARVGDDVFAPMLREELSASGVDITSVLLVPGSTGMAVITTVPGGQNSIVVVPGANAVLGPEVIDLEWDRIRRAQIVLAQLEIPLETVERLGDRCAAAGIPFILDPAPARELSAGLLRAVSWLTPNESEAFALTGTNLSKAEEPELRSIAQHFLGLGVRGVVLKLGARGAYIAHGSEHRWIRPFAVRAVDTTAAGDAFNGAFAASLVRLGDPLEAARVACAAGALSATRRGAIPSLPSAAELDRFLATSSQESPEFAAVESSSPRLG